MDQKLSGLNIAILATDGFEQVELTGPRTALEDAGATTKIISSKLGKIQGFHHDVKADQFDVDMAFEQVDTDQFDAILLPGGAMNADQIRMMPGAQKIVKEAQDENKPIAVICHGAWLLVSSNLVEGKTITSWPSLQDDIRNAGGKWVDQEVVVEGNLISSRKPDDIPAFNREIIDMLSQRASSQNRIRNDVQAGTPANR